MQASDARRRDPFVGRQRDLAELNAAIDETLAGRGRLILLSGEPGIGKTRLADELAGDAASRGMRVVWGRCWEGGGAPAYWPWIQVVRALIASLDPAGRHLVFESEHAAPMVETIAQIVPEIFSLAPRAARPQQLSHSDPQQSQFRLFDSIATLLKDAARISPMLVVLDDLHDADIASLTMLRFIARELRSAAIFIVGTYREVEARRLLELREQIGDLGRDARSLPLSGLSSAEVAEYFKMVIGEQADAALVGRVHKASAGNPLFVDGIVRGLIAERDQGRDITAHESFSAPHNVREAIGRRLAKLSDSARAVLEVAAAVGNEFDAAICMRVEEIPREQLNSQIDEAARDGVVVALGQGRYRFTHALIRGCIYEALDTNSRIRLHGSIGAAIEELYANDQAAHLAELAHHFREAGVTPKAIDYSQRAGSAARDVYATEDAIAEWEIGLKLARKEGDERSCAELLALLGPTRLFCGSDNHKGFEQSAAAIQLFEKLGLSADAARARADFGLQLAKDDDEDLTDIDRAWVHFEQAERVLLQLPPGESLGWLYTGMGCACWRSLDVLRGLEITSKAIALSDQVNRPDLRANYLLFRAYLLSYHGRIADALALEPVAKESLFVFLDQVRHGQCFGEIRCRLWDPTEAVRQLSNALRNPAGTEKLSPARRAVVERLAFAHAMMGDLERARNLLIESPSTSLSGLISLYAGEWIEAERTLKTSILKVRRSGSRVREADATSWYARLLRVSGNSARARAIFEEGLRTFGDGTLPLVEMWLRPELALLLAENGECDHAESQLTRCREIVDSGEDWRGLAGAVARAEAVVAAAEGRSKDAESCFERAIATFTRYSLPWEQAETLLQWGRVLSAGDEHRANEKFGTAIEIYRRYEAGERWLERVQEARSCRQRKDSMAEVEPASSWSPAENIFRKDGDFWTVTHGEKTFRLRNLKGLEYIAYLLAHPGVRIHACDLVAIVEGRAPAEAAASVGQAQAHGLQAASDLGDAGEALDTQAVSSYRRRLMEVRAELAEAERNNDSGARDRAQREFEALRHQLASAVGRHGRVRRSSSHVERARALVTKNIRASVERIRRNDTKLGEHFANSIHTGIFCAYLPQLKDKQYWQM
jgi:tetratricopeptide (TPR) repeat protein